MSVNPLHFLLKCEMPLPVEWNFLLCPALSADLCFMM